MEGIMYVNKDKICHLKSNMFAIIHYKQTRLEYSILSINLESHIKSVDDDNNTSKFIASNTHNHPDICFWVPAKYL